jgi:hypothetical protein
LFQGAGRPAREKTLPPLGWLLLEKARLNFQQVLLKKPGEKNQPKGFLPKGGVLLLKAKQPT